MWCQSRAWSESERCCGRKVMALPLSFWHEISSPNVPGALGLVPLSSLTLSLMSSCHWGWGVHHHGWSSLERCRSSNTGALPWLSWHAFSSHSVLGSVDSFTLISVSPDIPKIVRIQFSAGCLRQTIFMITLLVCFCTDLQFCSQWKWHCSFSFSFFFFLFSFFK